MSDHPLTERLRRLRLDVSPYAVTPNRRNRKAQPGRNRGIVELRLAASVVEAQPGAVARLRFGRKALHSRPKQAQPQSATEAQPGRNRLGGKLRSATGATVAQPGAVAPTGCYTVRTYGEAQPRNRSTHTPPHSFVHGEAMGRIKKQPPRPSLFQLTGEKYPHPGRKWPNTDIRLKVYLNNLAEAMKSPELDQVIWVLCAGCYWLTHEQAIEVGGLLDRLLREDYL